MNRVPTNDELAAIVAAYVAVQRAQPSPPPAPLSRWREAARALPEFPPRRRA